MSAHLIPRARAVRGIAAVAGAALLTGLAVTGAAAQAEDLPEIPDGGFDESTLADSVITYDPNVITYDPSVSVFELGEVSTEADTQVVTLSSDLLFAENSWELPSSAPARLAELIADAPDGATVTITGHTDSQDPIGQDFDNQELSENRAQAVADAVGDERPDLQLEVSGVASSQPAVAEIPDDPSTYAENRRVEISWEG